MTPDTNRSERIHRLAAFLREHGDVVLNGTRRLTLTTSCLNELNYIFRQFLGAQENESFDVPFGCSANSEFVHDVFFLHDFMQKTCSLKIVQSSQTIQGSLDLSKFHSLKILELKRVPPHLLVGFDSLVFQLETLICQRNISSLKEILRSRSKVPQPWVKIKVANFSYNGITTLGDSLALLPQLQYLDCSNNAISDASGVEYLQNVRVLNLSFNFLEKISIQNRGACDSLTVLYLTNNFIESTSGIERLRELRELDLSYNCLAESSSLTGFKQLYCLSILRLVGNPITFHKEYFSIVVCHLHRRAVTVNFRLDGRPLPKKLIQPANARIPLLRDADVPLPDPIVSVPSLQCRAESDDNRSLAEEIAGQNGGSPVACTSALHAVEFRLSASTEAEGSSLSSIDVMDATLGEKQKDVTKRKQRRSTRVVAILDQEGYVSSAMESGATTAVHDDFLSYKSQLESRKEQLGVEWLVGVSALKLPDAQSTPCGTPNTQASLEPDFSTENRTGSFDAKEAHSDSDSGRAQSVKTILSKEPVAIGTVKVIEEVKDRAVDDESPQRRISELSQGVDVLDEVPSDQLDEPSALMPLEGFSWTTAKREVTQEGSEIAEDMDSKLFLVQKCSDGNETSIFVGVKDDGMRESDSLTGKIIQRLDLNMLSSVSMHDGIAVKLKFDTTVRSKKERCYIFDSSEDAEEVVKILQPFVEAKARKDLYSEMLQCIKCNVQFPKHAAKKVVVSTTKDNVTTDVHESERCPQCDGDILLTLDTPEAVDALSCLASSAPEKSSSTTRKTSDSSSVGKSVQGCADNVSEESIETVMPDQHSSLYRPGFRKSASDITILSNPSQSSIMVISSTSANNGSAENGRDSEKTLSPPPTVVLPTLKEIVEEPVLNISRTDSLSIGYKSKASTSDTMLSDASYKSAQSYSNTSLQLKDTSDMPHTECPASLWESFDHREEMAPSSFTCPDHSVLLHLDVNVFKKEEAFICCMEVDLVTWSSLEEVPALLVISSNKAYFFKIKDNKEREDPKSWLMLWESRLLENLKVISLLLGNQGFCLSWQQEKGTTPWYMCLLRDADMCNCFLQYFTGVLQEKMAEPPSIVTDVSESLVQLANEVIKPCSEEDRDGSDEQEVALFILGFWSEQTDGALPSPPKPVCIVITKDNTFIAKVYYLKTPKGSSKAGIVRYEPLACQKISNITAVHLCKNNKIARLTFLDEDTGSEMQWTVAAKTVASLRSFLNMLRTPWEELFGVEMPLMLVAE